MNRFFVLCCILCFSYSLNAQEDTLVYEFPEQEASFPGGLPTLMTYLIDHFPNMEHLEAYPNSIGKITFCFIIEKDGTISNLTIECKDEECRRLLEKKYTDFPKWEPAQNSGAVCRSRHCLPMIIDFE